LLGEATRRARWYWHPSSAIEDAQVLCTHIIKLLLDSSHTGHRRINGPDVCACLTRPTTTSVTAYHVFVDLFSFHVSVPSLVIYISHSPKFLNDSSESRSCMLAIPSSLFFPLPVLSIKSFQKRMLLQNEQTSATKKKPLTNEI
jgi:hypothetical protein